MEVKERRPYRSLTARQDTERRYTSSSADSEDGKPNAKSYSSSETLKAFDHDSRMAYGTRVKDVVHHEVDEFGRPGAEFSLRDLGFGEALPSHVAAYRTELGLTHRDYSVSVGSDADTETDGIMSPEHAVRMWGRSNTKSGRSSCLSSRANSNLTLTDTEHENTENVLWEILEDISRVFSCRVIPHVLEAKLQDANPTCCVWEGTITSGCEPITAYPDVSANPGSLLRHRPDYFAAVTMRTGSEIAKAC